MELQPKSPLSVSEEPIQFIGVYEEPPTAGDAVSKSFNVTVPQDMTAETVELQANATLMTYDKTTVSQSEKTTLSIESADAIPMLPNQTAVPTDPDNDSQYEDVTGDGVVTREDLRVFQDHLTSSAVQSHPDAFDYSGDGDINTSDTQELYTEFVTNDDGEVTERVVITSIVDHLTDRVAPGLPNEQTITDLLVEYKNES
ncbi:dockerin type I domain-containing protein [Halorientalis persicus]|uniref:dockerin type I domain-containing protein n=1 Tax=Halorientalis persicus TaxID=1367881 RepID=UPI00111343CD|nr:dockerin type I domain-containing protein [Halorientalis persicus]